MLQHVGSEEDRLSLNQWAYQTLEKMELPLRPARNWGEYEKRFASFAWAARVLLAKDDVALPRNARELSQEQVDECEDLLAYCVPVIDPYVRLYLMRTNNAQNLELAGRIKRHLRLLGTQITETGNQRCASPVNRILAYSQSKALKIITVNSKRALGRCI